MSTQITTAFVNQYRAAVDLVVQQIDARCRDKVTVEPLTGEKGFFDYVGKADPQQRTTRHGDTQYSDTPHSRRLITGSTWDLADLIDKPDEVKTLIDPTNKYLQAFRGGFNRKIDKLIIDAASGTAYTGATGTTAVVLPSAQKVAVGGTGMTVDKLISALGIFLKNEVPEDWEKWCALGYQQIMNLLGETEVGSADYNLLRPLVEGKITKFMGFNFVHSEQLTLSGSSRLCPAWVKQGITLAINYDVEANVDKLPTKNYSTQVFMSMQMGASRMQEECVVEIACLES
jgi:hypothetical protein